MADNDVAGQLEILITIWETDAWRTLWQSLALPLVTFEDIGISRDTSDAGVWHECQRRQIVLVTGNRNNDDEDSLEATIRKSGALDSLPVFTLANPSRLKNDKPYAARTAIKLLQYLIEIDAVRGAGRLYLP